MYAEEKAAIRIAFQTQNSKIKEIKQTMEETKEFVNKQTRYIEKIRSDYFDRLNEVEVRHQTQIEELSKIVLDYISKGPTRGEKR